MSGELEAASRAGDQPEVDGEAGHGMSSQRPESLRVEAEAPVERTVVGGMGAPVGVNNRTGMEGDSDGPDAAAGNIGDEESGVDARMDGAAEAAEVHLDTQVAVHKEQGAEVALAGWHTVLEGHMGEHGEVRHEVARRDVEAGSKTAAAAREAAVSGLHSVHGVRDSAVDS